MLLPMNRAETLLKTSDYDLKDAPALAFCVFFSLDSMLPPLDFLEVPPRLMLAFFFAVPPRIILAFLSSFFFIERGFIAIGNSPSSF